MKIWSLPSLQSVGSWQDLRRFTSQALTNFSQALSRNIGFSDNIDCQIVNTILLNGPLNTIPHNLGKVPIGAMVLNQAAGGIVIKNIVQDPDWTDTNIYLRCTVTGQYTLIIVGS